jgi:hypothetical protein
MNVAEDKLENAGVRMWNRIVSSFVRSLGASLLSRSEEDRQFFQARLTLLSRVGCIIAFAATTYYAASSFLLERSTASDQSSKTILLCQLGSAILLLAVWQTSKRRRLGVGVLRCFDSGVGILLCTVFSVSYWLMDPIETVPDKPLLAAANVLILRAILLRAPHCGRWCSASCAPCRSWSSVD